MTPDDDTREIALVPAGDIIEAPMTTDEVETALTEFEHHVRLAAESSESAYRILRRIHDRKGWLALGYAHWNDLLRDRLTQSAHYVYRMMKIDQVREILSELLSVDVHRSVHIHTLSDSHADALSTLVSTPGLLKQTYLEVQEMTNGRPTEPEYRDAARAARGISKASQTQSTKVS